MKKLLIALFLLSPGVGWAQNVVPSEIKTKPGKLNTLKANTESKLVTWFSVDEDISLIPSEILKEPTFTVFNCLNPGKYTLLCIISEGVSLPKVYAIKIICGDVDPPPTPPNPNPPGPNPKPPEPDLPLSPLGKKFITEYGKDKKEPDQVAILRAFYAAMASHVKDNSVQTFADLQSDFTKAQKDAGLRPDAIRNLRIACRDHFWSIMPEQADKQMDDEIKQRLSMAFDEIAKALKEVK